MNEAESRRCIMLGQVIENLLDSQRAVMKVTTRI
jgi:hypothetical protein